jgi:hypothetical protein
MLFSSIFSFVAALAYTVSALPVTSPRHLSDSSVSNTTADTSLIFGRTLPWRAVKFAPKAIKEMKELGLDGMKMVKTMIHHHKVIESKKKENPHIEGALIKHILHPGGSDHKEPIHLVAKLIDAKNRVLRNTFNKGTSTHVYPHNNKAPKFYEDARKKSGLDPWLQTPKKQRGPKPRPKR